MTKLTPIRTAALTLVAEGNVTRQGFPLKGKPYYLVNHIKDNSKTSTLDFLRENGFIRSDAPNMRGTKIVITSKGQDYLNQS